MRKQTIRVLACGAVARLGVVTAVALDHPAQAPLAPVNDEIVWNDSGASGTVKTVREGHTTDGRTCREFQQRVTIGGKEEQAYGTACVQPDGSWKVNDTLAR